MEMQLLYAYIFFPHCAKNNSIWSHDDWFDVKDMASVDLGILDIKPY